MAENADLFTDYTAFWPFYLSQHSHPLTRGLHITGTLLGLAALLVAFIRHSFGCLLIALILGYGFAWLAHILVEKNKPATFAHPIWSLRGDFHMLILFLTGRLDAELKKHSIET